MVYFTFQSLLKHDAMIDLIAPGAEVRKLAGGFQFTEGPACDSAGNVYFSDQPNDRIMKWSIAGMLETFMQPSGRANGMCFDEEDKLWTCSDEKNEIWRIDASGRKEVMVGGYDGRLLNGPNDLWIRPDGGVYFTDPFYERDYWNRGPMEQDGEHVYYLSPDRTRLTRVAEDLKKPNGIIGTPDGKLLYVADIGAGRTFRYLIQADGKLKGKRLVCELGSDGMTIDNLGNIYLTEYAVTVVDPFGHTIARIEMPESGWVGNVCFGGPDRRTLFITASKNLWGLDMAVHGAGSQ